MSDQTMFETRLGDALRRYADAAPAEIDSMALATRVASVRGPLWQRLTLGGWRTAPAFGWVSVAILLLVLAIALIIAVAASRLLWHQPLPPSILGFTTTGSMAAPRGGHSTTLLPDGRVLVAGGNTQDLGGGYVVEKATAEIFDPVSGTFRPTGGMKVPRFLFTATELPDGRVLVVGGDPGAGATDSAELYDPASGTFSTTGSLPGPRRQHTATLLGTGDVLIAGGSDGNVPVQSAELYEPQSGTFVATGPLSRPRMLHGATRLADGRVLIMGGVLGDGAPTTAAELYDPSAGTFRTTGSMSLARVSPVAIALLDGDVLVIDPDNADADLYSASSGTFQAVGPMAAVHSVAVLLPDGRVLLAGGGTAIAELYDASSRAHRIPGLPGGGERGRAAGRRPRPPGARRRRAERAVRPLEGARGSRTGAVGGTRIARPDVVARSLRAHLSSRAREPAGRSRGCRAQRRERRLGDRLQLGRPLGGR
jgi:galactose oxidase-like protein